MGLRLAADDIVVLNARRLWQVELRVYEKGAMISQFHPAFSGSHRRTDILLKGCWNARKATLNFS
jgi:hypothetical protein